MSTTAAATALVSWEGEVAWKNGLTEVHSHWFVERVCALSSHSARELERNRTYYTPRTG